MTGGGDESVTEAEVVTATFDPVNCSNEYCVSDEQYLDMIRQYIWPSKFEWCLITFYVVVFVIGVVGNGLVCFVVWIDRQLRTVTNLFIVNLAVADLIIIVVCLPPTVLGDVTETWYLGPVMCKIVLYLQVRTCSLFVLRFFGRYPAMGVDPLLPECHGTSSGSWMERWIICGVLLGRNQ